ncbi:unnamed protein product [Lactuca virosa]|uniref:ABC transporter domain-containing protein n=1 Tax=Lactuca virosa TaxID=75947 RepID=A0AAU9LMI2_9ASTR|nr:unnamed protein product [Lactuca virosa]
MLNHRCQLQTWTQPWNLESQIKLNHHLHNYLFLRESLRPITLKFEDLVYTIKLQSGDDHCFSSSESKRTRILLNGVSGVVRPGELLAMLGPSGSGKTTLLTALGGRLPGKTSGSITYNGQSFSSSVKRKIGFVTQDDVLYPHLTVLETLTYAAMLRLPKSLTIEEKVEQAELIIIELGLTRCRNSIVGGPLIRGVSGGERKRVSIGQEMLVNPSLLLLDEPTSGLDSTTALRIMATLKGLARGGRSVVTTIHQPSSRLYWMFDKVVVLSEGCPIYSGQTCGVMEYLASIGYVPGFSLMNPADFLLDLANGVAPSTNPDDHRQYNQGKADSHEDRNSIKQSLISSYKKTLHHLIKDDIHRNIHDATRAHRGPQSSRCCDNRWTTSWWTQFKVLFKRGLRERKHESYSGLRIFPSDVCLNLIGSFMVALRYITLARSGGTSLLLFNILGLLPSIQCHIYVPSRATNANKRTLFFNVSPLLILLC